MVAAVLELGDAKTRFLGGLAGLLLDVLDLPVGLLVAGYLLEDDLGDLLVLVQIIAHGGGDLRHDHGTHVGVAELVLGLRLEDRFPHLDGDGADHPVADGVRLVGFVGKLVDALQDAFLERREVGAAVARVLTVDERVVGLTVAVAVGQRELQLLAAEVDDVVEPLALGLAVEQILKTVGGVVALVVEVERQAAVQIRVHPEALFDVVQIELEVFEELAVGQESHEGTVLLGRFSLVLTDQLAAFEARFAELAVAKAPHRELGGERVDGLGADAVETDGELEDVVVVLAAGVHHGDAFDELLERDAAPVVADGDAPLRRERDVDAAATSHDEFVDAVVDYLLEQDVDTVVRVAAVAHAPDVHPGAQPDVLQRGKGLDGIRGISVLSFGHG